MIQKSQNDDGSLDLVNYGLFDEDIEELYKLLKSANNVTVLDLGHNNISAEGARLLSTLPLRQLSIERNHLRDDGTSYLLRSPTLEWLDVSENGLSNAIQDDVKNNKTLRYICIDGNQIDKNIAKEITAHVQRTNEAKKQEAEQKSQDNQNAEAETPNAEIKRFTR